MAEFNSSKVVEILKKDEIIQDVILDENFVPWGPLSVVYDSKHSVELGNSIIPADAKNMPVFTFSLTDSSKKIEENDLFTLVMTDPDAPSRTDFKWSEICHYVSTDIKIPSNPIDAEIVGGNVVHDHIGPGPRKGTGPHRYVFLLYKQLEGKTGKDFTPVEDRFKWGYKSDKRIGAARWASLNKLELIAVNYFFAENQEK